MITIYSMFCGAGASFLCAFVCMLFGFGIRPPASREPIYVFVVGLVISMVSGMTFWIIAWCQFVYVTCLEPLIYS